MQSSLQFRHQTSVEPQMSHTSGSGSRAVAIAQYWTLGRRPAIPMRRSWASSRSLGVRMNDRRLTATLGRRATHAALVLTGLLPASMPAHAQADSANTYVRVSRSEMRVVFAPETSSTWGWSPAAPGSTHRPTHYWSAIVEGPDGPRTLGLHVRRDDDRARSFSSLQTVVRSGEATLCQPGMMTQCFDAMIEATVEGHRVVLTYRDSAAVSRMFAMRRTTFPAEG